MTTSSPDANELSNDDLDQVSGGKAAYIDEIDLPLNEFRALRDVDANLYSRLMQPGWTQEAFCNEIRHLGDDAASALFKVTGHSDWMGPVRGYQG